MEPSWEPLKRPGGVYEASWGRLGAALGHLEDVLGRREDVLWTFWGHLGDVSGTSRAAVSHPEAPWKPLEPFQSVSARKNHL